MNLSHIFASAIARRVAVVVVALVASWLGLSDAHAANWPTRGQAYDAAAGWTYSCAAAYPNVGGYGPAYNANFRVEYFDSPTNPSYRGRVDCMRPAGHPSGGYVSQPFGNQEYFPPADRCIAPAIHDPATGACVDNNERCLALNSQFANMGPQPRTWTSRCLANGCQMVMDNPQANTVAGLGTVYRGTLRVSGACAAISPPNTPDDPEGKKKDKECTPAPGGQTYCVKANGEKCYSAGSGRNVCWKDGETGTKNDNNIAQTRGPGTSTPPTPTPPPGETFVAPPSQPPVTTTSSGGGGPTIVTTVINNTTTNGTNAGGSGDNAGEPSTGGTEGGTGDDEGDPNAINGPDACEGTGYMPSGDPVLGATLTELWRIRCNGDKDKPDRASDTAALNSAIGDADGQFLADKEAAFSTAPGSGAINESLVSFGSGSCPEFPVVEIPFTGQVWTRPANFCSYVDAIRYLFIFAAYVWAMRIVGES